MQRHPTGLSGQQDTDYPVPPAPRAPAPVPVPVLRETPAPLFGLATEGGGFRAADALPHRSYRALFDNNLDAVLALDRLGRVVQANAAAERLTGYTEAELRQLGLVQLCTVDHAPRAASFFADALAGDARVLDLAIVRRDGRHRHVFVSGAPVVEHGIIGGVLCIARDITRRRKLETQLRDARREAARAAQVKDRFLSVLSHELRTPLTPVLATVQAIQDRHDIGEELRDAMIMIRRNLELEARLIDDLLDLNRLRRGRLELVRDHTDVHARIRNVLRLCETEVRSRGIEVELHLHAAACRLFADPGRVQQVIWNLLRNAIKYTPEGGRITVQTRNVQGAAEFPTTLFPWLTRPSDPGATPSLAEAGQRFILVEVLDSGVGISPEQLPRLFDSFERLDADAPLPEGVGLDLTISRALVELHGGYIWAHSDGPGTGSVFTVALPLRETDDAAQAGPDRGAPAPASQRLLAGQADRRTGSAGAGACGARILLVEDHPDTARVMSHLLSGYGYAVTTASSVSAAIAASGEAEFDLLVSDIGLPDGTGMDVMNHLRSRRPIPGVALSGFGMEEDIARSREAGFSEHMVKPINLRQFEAVLRRLLGSA